MNIWKILEIEKTKDKNAIQAAYREKLMKTHPEDDPEGFMELRKALEAALEEADRTDDEQQEDQPQWDDSPLGLWMQRVDQVYKTFSRRKDPQEWQDLLADQVCVNLDTKIQARSELLEYFLNNYFISREVLTLLDQHFGFMENLDELYEEFPRNYIDIIIVQGLQNQEYPPYRYLEGDDSCDFDEYLRTGIKLSQCITAGDTEKGLEAVEEMKSMGITNPFMEIDYAKVLCQAQRFEEAAYWMEDLLEEYPEIDDIRLMMGDIHFFKEEYEEAMEDYLSILDKDPDSEWALQGKAKCLMKTGEFKEAVGIFSNILEAHPYDTDAAAWLRECNVQYIEKLKKDIEESDDQDLMMDLGWCYFQNEEYDQALALMQYMEPDEKHKIGYESLVGRSALYADRHAKAIKHLQNWEALLKELPESEENDKKRKDQMPFCLLLQSYAWEKACDMKKAMEPAERAMALDPEDVEPVIHKGVILTRQWKLSEAIEYFSKAAEMKPDQHMAYTLRARALFHLGYYGDAYNDCERALEIFPYELAAYVFKVKILLEVGQFDGAEEILNYLESQALSGSELDFLKAFLTEARGDKEAAKAAYQAIIDAPEPGENDIFTVHDLAEVYHHMAVIQYNTPGATYGQVEDLIEKGLAENSKDVMLLEMKAEIASERKQFKKSLETYEILEDIAPGRMGIYGAMDNLHRELDQWDKALEYAEKQLQQTPTGYYHMRRGQLFAYMNRNKDAENDFRKAMELAPELSYPYNYMGVLLESLEKEEEALAYYLKAIETGEREDDICGEAYHNAGNLYCRMTEYISARMILQRGYDKTGSNRLLYEEVLAARRAGEFDDAEMLLKEYCLKENISNTSGRYYLEMGHICREQEDNYTAFEMYDAASDENCDAALEAGKILYYKGKYRKALKYMKKAIELYKDEHQNSDNMFFLSEFYMWAAKAALDGGFAGDARELAEAGLALIPDDYKRFESCVPMMEQMIGGLNTILGNYDKAEEYLKKALKSRKCDYCVHGVCIDACIEMIYLCLLTGRKDEALEYLAEGTAADPVDTDFRQLRKQIEKGKR